MQNLIAVTTTGGNGGNAGQSTAGYDGNGPSGGDGGQGIGMTLDVPPNAGAYSIFEAYIPNSNGVLLASQGGNAGTGGDQVSEGNGGLGGNGGNGGNIGFTIGRNPLLPTALTFIEATGAAVNLYSGGGRGGDGGYSAGGYGKEITGRDGGTGGNGGNIDVAIAGNINGYNGGSGIVAGSVGGDGGTGGGASDNSSTATGSNGGAAGNGGNVTIVQTGGTITAQGPAAAATGALQNFDNLTDPSQKVPLETSITAGGIIAISQGGQGGLAGMVDGFVTHSGNGAAGGNGGNVYVNLGGSSLGVLDNNAIVSTSGYNTFGVMALSRGGGGGNGNSGGGVYFRSGGSGGSGGDAGAAQVLVGNDTVTPYAKIVTTGDDADALIAISVGGDGGYSGDVNDTSTGGGAGFALYIGGVGGKGGNGNFAYISNGYYDPPPVDGSLPAFHPGDVILTSGSMSRGIVAQSVGGGGGRGGDATSTSLGSTMTIGGKGGAGGDGATVGAVNFGLISTSGSHSAGVFVQSVGGGGGSGGGALSRAIGAQITVSIAVGGDGGAGGNAGEADAYNIGQVETLGANAHAIFAQAVGGGGGLGGTAAAENYSTSLPDTPSISLTTSVGGKGGVAGTGGTINVINAGLLQTQGADAYGVFAQSVGGGGGVGGDATATSMAYQQAKLNITTAIGGSGGSGGDGGQVFVGNSGLISTSADTAIGVFAQSVGGGTGGFSKTNQGGIHAAGGFSAEVSVSIGGSGGASGDGGDVTVDNFVSTANFVDTSTFSNRDLIGAGGILTTGDMAAGIFAQSVGGGGGNGSDASGKGGNGQLSVNVGIGGNGGSGGNGGNVSVHHGTGSVQTYGAQSYGVFAQSVGGGGGTGGNAATGSGDDPEYAFPKQAANLAAGNVAQNPSEFTKVTDYLWDWKDNVKGAWDDKTRLQELYALNNDISTAEKPAFAGLQATDLSVDVGGGAGGNGGAAGNGGNVLVDSSGSIVTHGALAHAIFAQSIGGGGGVGGASAPATADDQLHNSVVESAISVGGSGGSGGNGGTVSVVNNPGGDIQTSGDLAFGILAQSIGGGGGVGGLSTPNAGLGNPMALSFGGAGTDTDILNGQGGTVTVTNNAAIQTFGNHGIGIVVHSVGGGGGIAAVTGQTLNAATGLFDSTTQTLVTGAVSPSLAQNFRANSNIGGNSTVQMGNGGTIETAGINAFGILAQSIGGGGGVMVIDPNNQVTVDQLAPYPERFNPVTGNTAGIVTVDIQGATHIYTKGNGAVGIVAQSLGGAGVLINGFDGVNVNTGSQNVRDRSDMGMGGAISITSTADIFTTGAYAHGIFAQVASGTGGVIGRTDGTGVVFRSGMGITNDCGGTSVLQGGDCGGAVVVNLQAGTISVTGAHSWGVVLESENVSYQPVQSGPNVDQSHAVLNLVYGAQIIASGQSDGAVLLNASYGDNVNNAGLIRGDASAGGYAVKSVGQNYYVANLATGIISGNFGSDCNGTCNSVGTITSTIDNRGLINAGNIIDLGAGKLTNTGTVSIHGTGVGTTTLTGNYAGNGRLLFDADLAAGTADKLVINGTANIAGTVSINAATMRNARLALVTASGGLTIDPKLSTTQTPLFGYKVETDGTSLFATPQARFNEQAATLGAASKAVAGHLQSLFDSGASMDRGFTALAALPSADAYSTALRSMTGGALGSMGAFRYLSSRNLVGNINQGCEIQDSQQPSCGWARVVAGASRLDETADAQGYRADTQSYEMGTQTEIGSQLTAGGALGYEHSTFKDVNGDARIGGESLLAGIGLRRVAGPLTIAGAVDGSYGWYRSQRTIHVGTSTDTAKSRPELWNVGVHLSASYLVPVGAGSFEPFAEMRGITVHSRAFAESGNSLFNLAVDAASDFAVSGTIGARIATTIAAGSKLRLHPFVSAAVELSNNNDWQTSARFVGQQQSDAFNIRTNAPGTYGRFSVGADLLGARNVDLTVSYNPEFGSRYSSHAGVARITFRF